MNNLDFCLIFDASMPPFAITPVLEVEDGSLHACCAECANREFPGWEKEDD